MMGFHPTGDIGGFTAYTSQRQKVVWFPKAPPEKPPSWFQLRQRNRFRLLGRLWRATPAVDRQLWATAAARAHLSISGHNLWVYYQLTRDRAAIATVERIAHLTLIA